MFFRKKKKKFTQINTFADSSSGWDSGLVRPQKRQNKDEMYQITFEMMKKGSTNPRGGKHVRQFGVMVGTDLRLVTSGDFVDAETYEALLAVDAIDAPNQQMSIPGLANDRPAPPPKPVVPEAMQHHNPVHLEVVGMASVRPMRRKTDEQTQSPEAGNRMRPANAPAAELPLKFAPAPVQQKKADPVPELPSEEKLEKLDAALPPVEMPEEEVQIEVISATPEEGDFPPLNLPDGVDMEDDAFDLPPVDLPGGVDMEDDACDLPPVDLPGGVDMEESVQEELSALETVIEAANESPPEKISHKPGEVQTELMDLLGENHPPAKPQKGGRPAKPASTSKKKRGKKNR